MMQFEDCTTIKQETIFPHDNEHTHSYYNSPSDLAKFHHKISTSSFMSFIY